MQCLCMSLLFCMAAVFIGNCIDIDYRYQIMVTVLHLVFMILMAPVKSKNRMSLKNRDIIKIRKKGVVGLVLINIVFCFVSHQLRGNIFMTLLLLLIDEMIAGTVNGFSLLEKGGDHYEERDC